MELLSVETWVVAVVVAVISVIILVFLVLQCVGMFRGNGYEYMLLNIAPGTSEEALLEHLRSNLQLKLKERGFLFGKTTALFSCTETLGRDEWENCEKYGGHGLVLVRKISNNQVEYSDKFAYRIRDSHIQTKVKEKTYQDANRKTFHRVQLTGPWTEIIVILDQLPDSDQFVSRQEVGSQKSFYSMRDESTKPLIGKNNRTDNHEQRQENRMVFVPPDVGPNCDSNKKEPLNIEKDLYHYMMKHHKGKMEDILHPKPFSSDFKSDVLVLEGPACLVSKAAEEIASLCRKLTTELSKVVFKLSEGINTEAFKSEAESRVAAPNKTLLLPVSDNTFVLYGPRDKLLKVVEGLKNLENHLRSPVVRIPVQPKSGSVTPHYQAEQRELMTSYPERVAPRSVLLPSGSVYSAPNVNNMEPKQNIHPSVFTKVDVKSEPIKPGYQQRSNGEATHNSFPGAVEKAKLNKITVSVLKGDLTKQNTNVIVNPANKKLLHGGGAAKAIAEAAGPQLVKECQDYIRSHGELKTGHVMHTTAGYLSPRTGIQHVIHAAGPSASVYPVQRDLESKLVETFFNCLKYANDRLQAKSISIPAISAGIYGAPKELVASAAHAAVKKFEHEGTGGAVTLEKVNFVNIDDESTDAFLEVFGGMRPRNASGDANMGKRGSAEREKSRSKSADQPKRMRILKNASGSFDHANGLSNGVATATVANGDDSDDCVICMETMTNPKALPCGHKFCEECIKDSFEKCQPKCPSCGRLFGVMRGNQPPGKMRFNTIPQSLAGYEKYKTILVEYDIPNGIQNDTHPNPGAQYWGTNRSAYLPDSKEGREVCDLLRKAFDAGLVFTVGRSSTTGRDNQVIWNDIHHKTSETGQYGYPDPTYLSRVKDELKAKGIVSDADDYKHKQTAI